jgi:two-component system chemotaxis response regulator CheB
MGDSPVRIVIVNDSATMRAALRAALAGVEGIEVVGEAADGAEAPVVVAAKRPTVVLMDVVMPRVDGYAATRAIMARSPVAIVLVSSVVNPRDVAVAMEALRSGALAIVEALPSPHDPAFAFRRDALVRLLRAMAHVQVQPPPPRTSPARTAHAAGVKPGGGHATAAVGIVASTGGPGALVEVLRPVPGTVSPPVLLVQHLARGFAEGFARWLGQATGRSVRIAEHQQQLERGAVYVAPDDRHLGLDAGLRAVVSDDPPVGPFRPSGTWLLRSLARALGPCARAVVMTGMGDDGADGAVELRRAGGRVAVQDAATSVVFGMAQATVDRGGADDVLPLDAIAAWVCDGAA